MSPERYICHDYDDIIDLPHHTSERHPRMSMPSRAAQFSPFAALTGYGDVIDETARLTGRKIVLEDDQRLEIDQKLEFLRALIKTRPEATFCYFVADNRKEGGSYDTVTGAVRRIDDVERSIVLANNKRIPLDDVYSISGSVFGNLFED